MIPKVSIVVPMYGVEQFLNKCVDSLLVQSLHDIEIILVDDGSPDRCGEIAEEHIVVAVGGQMLVCLKCFIMRQNKMMQILLLVDIVIGDMER